MKTHQKRWTTSDFDFDLPTELIAQRPSQKRGGSRLMTLKDGAASFTTFENILSFFKGDEVLVLNDTKVVPARLFGQKETGGQVEVFFLEMIDLQERSEDFAEVLLTTKASLPFLAMTRGRIKPNNRVHLPFGAVATLLGRDEHGRGIFDLDLPERFTKLEGLHTPLWAWLEEAGNLPLPPYIERTADANDQERYQTVFAKRPGAVAAPTAGLHFTTELLTALENKGVELAYVTLHVGPGTFLPVKAEHIEEHVMHSERYSIPLQTQKLLRSGRPIIAVGTTSVRALESFATLAEEDESLWGQEQEHSTDIFITPGYRWKVIDGLLTNFHLPQSTLLMLVSALAGYEQTLEAYQAAIKERLRFYSYGDASLFWRPDSRWS